jgi:CO/xanthine dehydrogenase FAD-binding subunit
MMAFEYVHPTEWKDAHRLLATEGSVAMMGGCDVLTKYRSGRLSKDLVVDLKHLSGLSEFEVSNLGANIGAATTLMKLATNSAFASYWPTISTVASRIASPAIRASATIVGNIAQNWSVSDLVPLLEVCDAELVVRGLTGDRRISMKDYGVAHSNSTLEKGEIISALLIGMPEPERQTVYERFTFKSGFDLPLVSIAISAIVRNGICSEVRVAVVGAHEMPIRSVSIESALEGRAIDKDSIDAAVLAMSDWSSPTTDFRASSQYRRYLLTVVLRKALIRFSAF